MDWHGFPMSGILHFCAVQQLRMNKAPWCSLHVSSVGSAEAELSRYVKPPAKECSTKSKRKRENNLNRSNKLFSFCNQTAPDTIIEQQTKSSESFEVFADFLRVLRFQRMAFAMLGTVGPVPPPVPHVGPVPHVPLVRSSRLGHGHEVATPKLRLATALMASALRQRPRYLVFFSPILFSEKKKSLPKLKVPWKKHTYLCMCDSGFAIYRCLGYFKHHI